MLKRVNPFQCTQVYIIMQQKGFSDLGYLGHYIHIIRKSSENRVDMNTFRIFILLLFSFFDFILCH